MTDPLDRLRQISAAGETFALWQHAVDVLPLGIIIYQLDLAGDGPEHLRLVAANTSAGPIVGVDLAHEIGKHILEIFPEAATPAHQLCSAVTKDTTEDLGYVDYADTRVRGRFRCRAYPLHSRHVAVGL